jgi:hypothetical protein
MKIHHPHSLHNSYYHSVRESNVLGLCTPSCKLQSNCYYKVPHTMTNSSTTHPWCYNECLCIITHELHSCEKCTSWVLYYVEHLVRDGPSIQPAEREHNAAIIGNLCKHNITLYEQLHTLNAMTEESNTQVKQTEQALQNAYAQIAELTDQLASIQEDRLHKVPRQIESPCTPISTHTNLPIDGECNTMHPISAPPLLLAQMQPIDPTDILANAQALVPDPTTAAPKIRFSTLLPIIYYRADNSLHTSDPSVHLTPDRDIDFCGHKHYILTMGDTSLNGVPGFCTTLV